MYRATYSSSGVHLGVVAQEDAHNVGLVGSGGQMKWRLATHRRCIGARSVLQQVDDNVHAAHETGHMQWSQTRLATRNIVSIH